MTIGVTVNGEPLQLETGTTVAALINRLDLGGKRVAVEVNGEVIPRPFHATHTLRTDDRIEVVHAIGGG